jgi:hypothetical protein
MPLTSTHFSIGRGRWFFTWDDIGRYLGWVWWQGAGVCAHVTQLQKRGWALVDATYEPVGGLDERGAFGFPVFVCGGLWMTDVEAHHPLLWVTTSRCTNETGSALPASR